MSSTSSKRALFTFVMAFVFAALAIGCGRSPAMPRTPEKVMVRVDANAADAKVVPCSDCDDEDDDDDDPPVARKPAPVEYVRMSEWQEPESAKRAAAEVVQSGDGGKRYTEFPKLTLHRPIEETRVYGRYLWR